MANLAFKRAIAGMGAVKNGGISSVAVGSSPTGDALRAATTPTTGRSLQLNQDLELLDCVSLSDKISALRMHKLAIALRPIVGNGSSGGRTMLLTASRWEIRKAILSLCCTPPTTCEVRTKPVLVLQ